MRTRIVLLAVVCFFAMAQASVAADFHVVIMASKDPKVEGPKYATLSKYIASKTSEIGEIKLKIAKSYPDAVKLFQGGEVEGMFSGSFVASVFIKKGVAKPLVRPNSTNGVSTYKALVAGPKGSADFKGIGDWKGKKVAYCSLASSGEIFARSMLKPGEKPEDYYTPVKAKSHQAALNAVKSGAADYAVFKNLIWDQGKNPELSVIGGDKAENPNNTFIMSTAAFEKNGETLRNILVGLESDSSGLAMAVKKAFKIQSFLPTSEADFDHTYSIVKSANIDPATFNFAF
jgi:ABC-type phosphate/phosphonate transport system substrate-binding protein